jgi:PBSX family phage terminase large subunit
MPYSLSEKQKIAMTWWNKAKYSDYDSIICDGAVRSGKTFSMSIGFIAWAMTNFNRRNFALCGKTIKSLKRNVMDSLLEMLRSSGFLCIEKVSAGYVDIKMDNISNRFYIFGGKDESSASLIQGITLAGVLFDEVVLMPKSFVEQAIARCSVTNSKMWFNCNPENPSNWFYREWIKNHESKKALYLHFTMNDNPSLSYEIKERYKRLYKGVFYTRFIKGEWTAAEGVIYSVFSEDKNVVPLEKMPDSSCFEKYVISCDYGTVNPSSFGLWGKIDDKWIRIKEYYFDSSKEGYMRTDSEHYEQLKKLAGDRKIEEIIVDPSAASFIECIRRDGRYKVKKAVNDVLTGIRRTSGYLQQGRILISEECEDIIKEFSLYCWENGSGRDIPRKENDHAMDDMRYFVNSYLVSEDVRSDFFVGSMAR